MINCPLCGSINTQLEKEIKSTNISGSLLYKNIVIMWCYECDHMFNYLQPEKVKALEDYYEKEYIKNKFTPTKIDGYDGDYHKITSKFNINFKNISKIFVITQNDIYNYVNDIGCFNNDNYINEFCKFNEGEYRKDNLMIFDQFLEHCWDLENVMKNIKEMIARNGLIYISIPDFFGYRGNDYLYLIKEHLHHFKSENVIKLFKRHGFSLIDEKESSLSLLNDKIEMPNLEFLFKKDEEIFNPDGTFCYGVGREFLYLIENGAFVDVEINGLIDDTTCKKGEFVNRLKIYSSEIIKNLSEDSTIIVTALYHQEEISKKIKGMGYKGNISTLDRKEALDYI
ncbi:MAG: hypothetical protein ACTSQG_00155 [Promethearchaeota archaeon]